MNILFFILGLLAYVMGYSVFSSAKSAMHETVGLLIFLIGTVFFVGAGIIDAINKKSKIDTQDKVTKQA
ncbi:MAG: hypothetical protein HRU25_02630 [Psychrobium sp.]|nr:hypothetical protein [Psychrobium sp.]